MRTCYDSTAAADIPADAAMVAGYVDGLYRWSDADWSRFPNAVKVRIAVFSWTDDGEVGDVEEGAMTPEGAAAWLRMRRIAGADPTLYVNRSNWEEARTAVAAIGEPEPHWWLASYDNDPTIPDGCVAKQYANAPLTGGHYDASVAADYWPGVDTLSQEIIDMVNKLAADLADHKRETFESIEAMKAAYNPLVGHIHPPSQPEQPK